MRGFSATISPERRPRLVVMVRAPVAGRVKTRLGRDIGMTGAAWWYRHQVRRLLRRIADPRWQVVLAVTPDRAAGAGFWPARLARVAQGGGDLGTRMTRLFRELPPGPVLIAGSDVPGITRRHIARAFAALDRSGAVIGPADDGGYWLIGLKRTGAVPRGLLDGVRWSTRFAQVDTLVALRNRRIALADRLADVDTAADLRRGRRKYRVVKNRGA